MIPTSFPPSVSQYLVTRWHEFQFVCVYQGYGLYKSETDDRFRAKQEVLYFAQSPNGEDRLISGHISTVFEWVESMTGYDGPRPDFRQFLPGWLRPCTNKECFCGIMTRTDRWIGNTREWFFLCGKCGREEDE